MPRSLLLRNAFRTLTVRSRPLVLCRESQVRTLSRTSSDNTPRVPPRLPGQNVDITPFSTGGSGRPSESWNQESNATMDQSQNDAALSQLQMIAYGLNPLDPASEGHKYGLPDLPLPSETTLKNRYDPVVVQVTKLIMRDGKLSKAQRHMATILNILRTSPTPKLNPTRPLLPGAPPPEQLPLNPVLYLSLAIDSVAPLVRIRGYKGIAGGGASLEVPIPLKARQRRRMAFQWLLDVVNKKMSKGSGRDMFPQRVAEEIIAIVEGRSSVWDKRYLVHRQGTIARANMNNPRLNKK